MPNKLQEEKQSAGTTDNTITKIFSMDFASLYPSTMKVFTTRNRVSEINKILNKIKNV